MAEVIPMFSFGEPVKDSNLSSQVVRQNLDSLGTTNYTTDVNYPANPRPGMMRVLNEADAYTNIKLQMFIKASASALAGSWFTLLEHLELLLPFTRYRLLSYSSATVWTVNHGLGVRPLVQCFNTANFEITPASIQHVLVGADWDRVVVTHGGPIAGYVILVG